MSACFVTNLPHEIFAAGRVCTDDDTSTTVAESRREVAATAARRHKKTKKEVQAATRTARPRTMTMNDDISYDTTGRLSADDELMMSDIPVTRPRGESITEVSKHSLLLPAVALRSNAS
mmetsp:Transcript_10142/g.28914  ORF Transcript_10142/g.28914 Transcript_10142/m.28914 type:complete len:119 (+) Transcript_10142:146-502(+)